MEHIVLEYDENTRTALVVATSGGREPVLSGHASPYIVADGYDFESRSWGAGHYFTDIAEAKIDYERSCRHPYPLAEGKLRDDEFCTIRWCREDVAAALSEYLAYPIPATEKNIDTAIGQLMAHDNFQDRSIEDGWETIGGIIVEDELDLGLSTKQGVDFYRDAFGLSNFTEAVVWPSSEGDAAFVMTSAVDSEDGDLAVYKIDAGLIGDSEITVDDIERLGGKRELCVHKHGFDGIEAIRAFANRVAVDRFDERFGVNNLYGDLPDLAPTLRKVTEDARTAVQQPRDPQAIAAAALSAAEGGAKGAVELVGNKRGGPLSRRAVPAATFFRLGVSIWMELSISSSSSTTTSPGAPSSPAPSTGSCRPSTGTTRPTSSPWDTTIRLATGRTARYSTTS